MNKTLIQLDKAIAIMRRAQNLNMTYWQRLNYNPHYPRPNLGTDLPRVVSTEEELHACGNTACFAGYVAISPEFKADGGRVGVVGEPVLKDIESKYIWIRVSKVIAQWLGITEKEADNLVQGDTFIGGNEKRPTLVCRFYGKEWSKVTPQDVIEKLEILKDKYKDED